MLLSAFSIPAFAGDDNATGGDGSTHPAAEGYGWYNSYQYLYKVTLFVGKRDTVTKQSSLTNDFYRVGTVIVKKTGWSVSSSVMFGNGTKIDYYSGTPMTQLQNPYIISDANCPKIPICCGGDIDIVKQYFGSTGTMNTLLNAIAAKAGTNAYGMLKNKTFTINGTTKSGWAQSDLLPNGTSNKVPWVIIYEPMILMHLKDKVSQVAFTATEYAIAQLNGWFDWNYSKGEGQNVAILPRRHLPSSIQLEESWFGYPVYPVHSDDYNWPWEDIIKGGGWGMRWLGPSIDNGIDLSCEIIEYDPSPIIEEPVNHKIVWKNNKNREQTVLCEIYSGDYLVTSYTLTIPGNSSVTRNTRLIYHATRTHKMIAKINYANRYSETNPNNNTSTITVVPRSSDKPAIDYGCYFGGVETPEPNGYGQVEVTWKNYKRDVGTVLCELYRDSTLIWSGYKTFEGYEAITETYSVYYPGTSERTLTAKINYANRNDETDPNDNMRQRTVKPVPPVDGTYDFSVSGIAISPSATVYQGDGITITFRSDNWNKDLSYENILVELLVGNEVVASEYVNFTPYGSNNHSYTIALTDVGTKLVAARINWENRYDEDNSTNNFTSTTAYVRPYYEFSVANLEVNPLEVSKNGSVTIGFRTFNWDRHNSYNNIPVQVIYDGKVVYTEYVSYEPYGYVQHSLNLNVGLQTGSHDLYVRVNWQNHLSEVNINNNQTDSLLITVIDPVDLGIMPVWPNAPYREGLEVVTSFRIYNYSGNDVVPSDNVAVGFEAYYYENSTKVTIKTMTWNQAVIPNGDSNLVWFKWKVPSGIAGKKVFISATLNKDATVSESDWSNNIANMTETIAEVLDSSTPDTRYEREKPSDYRQTPAPLTYGGTAVWSIWEYKNGSFVKVNYGIQISDAKPEVTPDQNSPSAVYSNGSWTMKSGYGISVSYTPGIENINGYAHPDSGAYTGIQTAYALFPEFGYSTDNGKYRTLEKADGKWQFEPNTLADRNGRIHFTPLWFPDGDYVVSVTASDFWTPAGMISGSRNASAITISGSAYDDWYLGR